jgi:hypothetical protein
VRAHQRAVAEKPFPVHDLGDPEILEQLVRHLRYVVNDDALGIEFVLVLRQLCRREKRFNTSNRHDFGPVPRVFLDRPVD